MCHVPTNQASPFYVQKYGAITYDGITKNYEVITTNDELAANARGAAKVLPRRRRAARHFGSDEERRARQRRRPDRGAYLCLRRVAVNERRVEATAARAKPGCVIRDAQVDHRHVHAGSDFDGRRRRGAAGCAH